jgi:hypothetical protein
MENKFAMRELAFMRGEQYKLEQNHPYLSEVTRGLLLLGGDVVVFDGWASPDNLEILIPTGHSVAASEIDQTLAHEYNCRLGMCWDNTKKIMRYNPDTFEPVYAWALTSYDGVFSYWMEHFILRDKFTGKYHESTPIGEMLWYFVMDIDIEMFMELHDSTPFFYY